MAWRVTLDSSLNKDTRSIVRNAINEKLPSAKTAGTATKEVISKDIQDLAGRLSEVLAILANPSATPGAAADVELDHLWLYIQRIPEGEATSTDIYVYTSSDSES